MKNPGEKNLRAGSPVGIEVKKRENERSSLISDYLVNGGSFTLTNSSSKLGPVAVFAPRCETGEFWETEFNSESILKSAKKDFIFWSEQWQLISITYTNAMIHCYLSTGTMK